MIGWLAGSVSFSVNFPKLLGRPQNSGMTSSLSLFFNFSWDGMSKLLLSTNATPNWMSGHIESPSWIAALEASNNCPIVFTWKPSGPKSKIHIGCAGGISKTVLQKVFWPDLLLLMLLKFDDQSRTNRKRVCNAVLQIWKKNLASSLPVPTRKNSSTSFLPTSLSSKCTEESFTMASNTIATWSRRRCPAGRSTTGTIYSKEDVVIDRPPYLLAAQTLVGLLRGNWHLLT